LTFDDPVSSLDHYNRERIARRLVEESRIRQVIIFTHDSVFVRNLMETATERTLPLTAGRLDWKDSRPGYFFEDIPWDMSQVSTRFDSLEKRLGEIKRKRSPQTSQEDKERIEAWYGYCSLPIYFPIHSRSFFV
jgi:energy-coupling factor transporter ATP-binding protein EcfA2